MISRTFRLHQNGRTLFSWFRANGDWPTLPVLHPREHLQIRFYEGVGKGQSDVLLDGVLIYRFEENPNPPEFNDFHRVEFLYDNDLWIIEYRRDDG